MAIKAVQIWMRRAFSLVPTKVFSLRFCLSALKNSCRVRDWRGADLARFQPLPIRTAREVFPQAAHPVSFVERVMGPVGRRPLSLPLPSPGQRLDFPVPIQPQDVVEVLITPPPPSHTRLSPPF